MNLSLVSDAIKYKRPTAVFALHVGANDLVVVDSWVCAEDPIAPTPETLDVWCTEWQATQDYALQQFDAGLCIGREAQVFSIAELTRVAPYSYTINEMIRYKNFWGVPNTVVGLKEFGESLVTGNLITQSDYDKLAGILLEQGIVL